MEDADTLLPAKRRVDWLKSKAIHDS